MRGLAFGNLGGNANYVSSVCKLAAAGSSWRNSFVNLDKYNCSFGVWQGTNHISLIATLPPPQVEKYFFVDNLYRWICPIRTNTFTIWKNKFAYLDKYLSNLDKHILQFGVCQRTKARQMPLLGLETSLKRGQKTPNWWGHTKWLDAHGPQWKNTRKKMISVKKWFSISYMLNSFLELFINLDSQNLKFWKLCNFYHWWHKY